MPRDKKHAGMYFGRSGISSPFSVCLCTCSCAQGVTSRMRDRSGFISTGTFRRPSSPALTASTVSVYLSFCSFACSFAVPVSCVLCFVLTLFSFTICLFLLSSLVSFSSRALLFSFSLHARVHKGSGSHVNVCPRPCFDHLSMGQARNPPTTGASYFAVNTLDLPECMLCLSLFFVSSVKFSPLSLTLSFSFLSLSLSLSLSFSLSLCSQVVGVSHSIPPTSLCEQLPIGQVFNPPTPMGHTNMRSPCPHATLTVAPTTCASSPRD